MCPQLLRGVKKGCLLLPWCWLFAVSRGWRQTAAGLPAPVSLQQDGRPCRPPCPPPLSEPPRPCWGSLGFPGLCVSCSGLTRRSDGNGRMKCSGPMQAPWVDGTWCFVGSRFCVPKINQRQPLPHILQELCGVCDHHSGVRWRGHPCAVIGGPILSPKGDPQVPGLWGYGVQRIPHKTVSLPSCRERWEQWVWPVLRVLRSFSAGACPSRFAWPLSPAAAGGWTPGQEAPSPGSAAQLSGETLHVAVLLSPWEQSKQTWLPGRL